LVSPVGIEVNGWVVVLDESLEFNVEDDWLNVEWVEDS
jgi:hypothetical protein